MTRARNALALVAIAAALSGQSLRTEGGDPFYTGLLRDGEILADQGKAAAAAKSLRTACFGLLDEPRPLTRCLVRLALAQAASGDAGGFRLTFNRILESEAQGPGYAAAELAPAVRSAFEQLVRQRIPTATLTSSPTFAHLATAAPPPDDGKKKGRHDRPAKAVPASEPATAATAAAPPPPKAPAETAAPVPAAATPVTAPVASVVLSVDETAALERAREALRTARLAGDLAKPGTEVRKIADAHPESPSANAIAGEIAYRSSQWSEAVSYLRRSGLPADQPLLSFYLAVALYESGDQKAAATVLRPVLPSLQRTAYVQSYIAKILPP